MIDETPIKKEKTMDTVRLSIEKAKGYSGIRSRASYIARIDGVDDEYKFRREFLKADHIDWGDSQLYRRPKGVWREFYDVAPGLYEVQQYGERRYKIVFIKNGKTGALTIDALRARAIASEMSKGRQFEDARIATMPAQQKTI